MGELVAATHGVVKVGRSRCRCASPLPRCPPRYSPLSMAGENSPASGPTTHHRSQRVLPLIRVDVAHIHPDLVGDWDSGPAGNMAPTAHVPDAHEGQLRTTASPGIRFAAVDTTDMPP